MVLGWTVPHCAGPETNCANTTVLLFSGLPTLHREYGSTPEEAVDLYMCVCVWVGAIQTLARQ